MARLTAAEVERVYRACLWREGEEPTDRAERLAASVDGEGVMATTAFHPGRLAERAPEVRDLLGQLPATFRTDGVEGAGGGWSFLNLCMRADGEQWTGEHQMCDKLVMLGQAVGAVAWNLPRSLWSACPGGLPYLSINLGA